MFNPFRWFDNLIKWFSEGISRKAKILISLFLLFFIIGAGFVGYKIDTYFQESPEACKLCHPIMTESYKSWAQSAHNVVACKECHHATRKTQMEKLYRFVFLGQTTIEPRYGEIVAPSQLCMNCHWEGDKRYPDATIIANSPYHARHVFMEKMECSQCHGFVGDVPHNFLPDEKHCLKCHPGKEVHGTGMQKLACINCHTDRAIDLKPTRDKCLFCHSADNAIRKRLIQDGTIDVKHFQPSPEIIKKATKVDASPNAPMQFYCYECHKPHKEARADWKDCLRCHAGIPKTGNHALHMQFGMQCKDCHKPHEWRVTEARARGKDCLKCHEYKNPADFIR